MIIKRTKIYSFFGFGKKKPDVKEYKPKQFIPYTPQIEAEIKKILPKEYTKLQDFYKYLGKLENEIGIYPEFGVTIYSRVEDLWDMLELEYDVSSVSEFIEENDRIEIINEYNLNDRLYWNFRLKRWETAEGKMLSWNDVKNWIIGVYESEKKWWEEDYSRFGENGTDYIEYCDKAIKKAKSVL